MPRKMALSNKGPSAVGTSEEILGPNRFSWDFPDSSVDKEFSCMREIPTQFLGWEDPLEKG